jgi:alkylhydroperoxidase family enzyme
VHVLLGRAAGISEEKLAHLGDEVLPDGLYSSAEAAIVRYAQRSTRMQPIDDDLYAVLTEHFSTSQVIEICFTVGLSNIVNRFHATFHTDLDAWVVDALGSCPLEYPVVPPKAEGQSDDAVR